MIKNWFVVGDQHGVFTSFKNLPAEYQNEETGVVILGDAGFNFNLNQHDNHRKKGFTKRNKCYVYCVRGNHEARPSAVEDMKLVYDENVMGEVWMQEKYPTIRYFKDFGRYHLGPYSVYVIGGAYSVDKWHRLRMDWPWFPDEQLTAEEMAACEEDLKYHGGLVDFVFTHTCPIGWEPTDLFIGGIDQSQVDKTMEVWMQKLRDEKLLDSTWGWLFGHFHADRAERPYVEMCYNDIENLDEIKERWHNYYHTGELPWWFPKSPQFYWDGPQCKAAILTEEKKDKEEG